MEQDSNGIEKLQKLLLKAKSIQLEISSVLDDVLKNKRSISDEKRKSLFALRSFLCMPRLNHRHHQFIESFQSASYRFQRIAQAGVIKRAEASPPRTINVKDRGRRFAHELGLPVPHVEVAGDLDSVEIADLCVLKPRQSDGGKCIYAPVLKFDGGVEDLFSGQEYRSALDFKDKVRQDFQRLRVRTDEWFKEEAIVGSGGSPRETFDVKFYCFYGKVGIVFQIDRWGGRRFADFDMNGRPVDSGKHPVDPNMQPVFGGDLVKQAEEISSKVPWPHVRIDFLVSDVDVRFGEFTLRPGSPGTFSDEWDRRLGRLFVEAQARLYEDLMGGKVFPEYQRAVSELGGSAY